MKIVLFARNPYLMASLEKPKAECWFEFLGSAEMLNYQRNAQGDFTPAAMAPPMR